MRLIRNIKALAILTTVICAFACGKKVDCDNAQACVRNTGSDTIMYCWGCNINADTLLPGATTCISVGEVRVNNGLFGSSSSTQTVTFNSDNGSFYFEVDECREERTIN